MGAKESEKPKKIQISVRIEAELKKAFDEICEQEGYSPTALFRKWIREFVENKKKGGKDG
jgi:predicted transcriptional regulator